MIQCTGWRDAEREQLAAIVADRNLPRKHVERARIVPASGDWQSAQRVAQTIGVSRPTVWRWQQRFSESGVEGLLRYKTRKPGKSPIAADTTAGGALACTEPPRQATHWTGSGDGQATGISVGSVQRIWRAHKLQPHRLRAFKRSRRPGFATILEMLGFVSIRRPCRGAVDRRKEPDPSPRPDPARIAGQARPLPDHDA